MMNSLICKECLPITRKGQKPEPPGNEIGRPVEQLINCLNVTPTVGNANSNHNETSAPTMLTDIKAFTNMMWARVWRKNNPCVSGGTADCQNSHVEQGGTTH